MGSGFSVVRLDDGVHAEVREGLRGGDDAGLDAGVECPELDVDELVSRALRPRRFPAGLAQQGRRCVLQRQVAVSGRPGLLAGRCLLLSTAPGLALQARSLVDSEPCEGGAQPAGARE